MANKSVKSTNHIVVLLLDMEKEINRLRDGMAALADHMGAGHLECADRIRALINPPESNRT